MKKNTIIILLSILLLISIIFSIYNTFCIKKFITDFREKTGISLEKQDLDNMYEKPFEEKIDYNNTNLEYIFQKWEWYDIHIYNLTSSIDLAKYKKQSLIYPSINSDLEIFIQENPEKSDLEKLKNIISNSWIKKLALVWYDDKYADIFKEKDFSNLNSLYIDWKTKTDFVNTFKILKEKLKNSLNFNNLDLSINSDLKNKELDLLKDFNMRSLVIQNKSITEKQAKYLLEKSETLKEINILDYWFFRKNKGKILFNKK